LNFENDLLTPKLGEDGKEIVMSRDDLFSAHDFDIKLDIDAKLPRKFFKVLSGLKKNGI